MIPKLDERALMEKALIMYVDALMRSSVAFSVERYLVENLQNELATWRKVAELRNDPKTRQFCYERSINAIANYEQSVARWHEFTKESK